MTRQEEAIQITMEQFIHDCGIEQEDEVAMAWFKARCHYLQAELLSERQKNKEMGERMEMIQESAEVLAADTTMGFVNSKLAKSIAALASPHPPEKEEQG